jgi:hypothetical protein
MAVVGAALVALNVWRRKSNSRSQFPAPASRETDSRSRFWQPMALAAILLFVLVIPSDATRDIPSRYGHRHPGLEYSAMYPRIRR